IRDFHVTGVQTCALPISEVTTWMISKGTLLRDCARKSALVQPVARTGPAGIVRPCFYTEKYRIQKPAIGKTYSGSEAASLLPSSRRGEELLPGRRAAAH